MERMACKHCGVEFSFPQRHLRRRFCSRACSGAWVKANAKPSGKATICPKCGSEKKRNHPYCMPCQVQYHRDRRSDPEKRERYNRYGREYYARQKALGTAFYQKLRSACLAAYGGECACCGEGAMEFLAIDHVNGGGNAHRKSLSPSGGKGSSMAAMRWIRDNGYPEGFRVLCHNCNFSYGAHGYCPHQKK